MNYKMFIITFVLFSLKAYSFEGISYSSFDIYNSSYEQHFQYTKSQKVHLLEVDPTKCVISPSRALDDGLGRESALSLSMRKGAIASINGGFFSIGGTFDGLSRGALKIHEWIALPVKPRGCIGWSEEQSTPFLDRLLVEIEGEHNNHAFKIDGLNAPQGSTKAILFTPTFHRTTMTDGQRQELIIKNGIVEACYERGSSPIPLDGQVLSIGQDHPLYGAFSVGDPLDFSFTLKPLLFPEISWDDLPYIVGGTPLLIHKKLSFIDVKEEKTLSTFLSKRHARTAIGILPNGHWLFVVVEQTSYFDGMTIEELTNLMRSFSCVYALNLDGGGSSTMVFDGSVKNTPRGDKDEDEGSLKLRRISDAILIYESP